MTTTDDTMTTAPNCPYCDLLLTDNDRDSETGDYWSAHMACAWAAPDGEWYVRTVQNAATPPRENVVRFRSQRRAREEAAHLRRWNQRNWNCGRHLDIFVGRG